MNNTLNAMLSVVGIAFILCVPAYFTHIVVMLLNIFDGKGHALAEVAVLLIGIVFAPVGIIHGWMIWLGFNVVNMI